MQYKALGKKVDLKIIQRPSENAVDFLELHTEFSSALELFERIMTFHFLNNGEPYQCILIPVNYRKCRVDFLESI